MNKQKFNDIVSKPESIIADDQSGLVELANAYPYSQIIHALNAKAHSIDKNEASKTFLNVAAMYTTNRQVLKEVFLAKPRIKEKDSQTAEKPDNTKKSNQKTQVKKPKQKKITIDVTELNKESQQVRNSIWADLEQLKASKASYIEYLNNESDSTLDSKPTSGVNESKKPKTTSTKVVKTTKKATTKKAATSKVNKTVTATKSAKSNKAKTSSTTTNKKPTATPSRTSDKKRTGKTTKKAVPSKSKKTVTSNKQKEVKKVTVTAKPANAKKEVKKKPKVDTRKVTIDEQIHLIDEFIDKKPSISSKPIVSVESNQKDLSEKSTNFGDDLISENLALILIDQGKQQKALEMYKKLIWKFPQKKSYFAAQIEKLKK